MDLGVSDVSVPWQLTVVIQWKRVYNVS